MKLTDFIHKYKVPYLFIAPAIFFYCLFILFPIVENIRLSFYQWTALSPERVFVGFDNFVALVHDSVFWLALYHNVVYVAGSLGYIVPMGLLLALTVNSPLIKFRKIFRTIFFLPNIICIIAIGLLWTFIYQPMFGLLNMMFESIGLSSLKRVWLGDLHTALGAVIWVTNWASVGFAMVLFLAKLQNIPKVLYEAAKIDGANRRISFLYVTLPELKEVLILIVLFFTISSFKTFGVIFVMTYGGPAHSTEVITTWMYLSAFNQDRMGYGSALATVLLVIIFMVSFFFLKFTRSGEKVA